MQRREVATSIVVYGEVVEYLRGFTDFLRHHRALQWVLWEIQPFELTFETLEQYADLRRAMRTPHGPGLIGDMDTLIAATALVHDLTVVTSDQHFQRVPGLSVKESPTPMMRSA